MRIVVVYESLYGNTKTIAEAVAQGLRDYGTLTLGSVDNIAPEYAIGADLLVLGGPTHAHGMASKRTREAAEADTKHGPVRRGKRVLRDWIEGLHTDHRAAAAFDTRFDKPKLVTGSAAKGISHRLREKGFDVKSTESFFVEGMDGPLEPGERERAMEWGRTLGRALRPAVHSSA